MNQVCCNSKILWCLQLLSSFCFLEFHSYSLESSCCWSANQVVAEVSAQFLIVIVALRDHHLSSMLWKKHWRILATRGSFKIIYSSSFLLIEYLSIKVGRLFCLIVMLRFLKPWQPYHPLGIVEKSWVNRSALRWFHDV